VVWVLEIFAVAHLVGVRYGSGVGRGGVLAGLCFCSSSRIGFANGAG